MLGPPKTRDLNRPVLISLESYVPQGHFFRPLHRVLDLSFVRDLVADRYALGGRPAIDPEGFFRLHLIMLCSGIRSERQLMAQASYNLAMRWYAGYNLDQSLPDHSSLSKIRTRRGLSIFRCFVETITAPCLQAGLVWGEELLFDATKVRANAALDSLVPPLHLLTEEHLAQREPAAPPTALWEQNNARWDLLDECRLAPDRPASGSYQRKSDRRVSTTDPDAVAMRTHGERATLGYHTHDVIDGGKARIILNALVTPADVMEDAPMLPLLRRAIFRWHVRPRQVIGDTTYGTAENIRPREASGIRASVPLPDWEQRTPCFGSSLFTDDAGHDVYQCPQGETLRKQKTKDTEAKVVYKADAAICNICPLKAACTASDHGREISRPFDADYLDRVRGDHEIEAYAKAMRKRKVWIEPGAGALWAAWAGSGRRSSGRGCASSGCGD
jgi:transposase